ncbi:Glycerate-and formate-dehydrogenase [Neofusicoccum parvum]|uniref:Glycerate-and formate-dehydrogenase n=1 Tax=Neofusicoccum parvum TaxID=310453 RepID=A0ACB5SM63_9PEZI|nr:Glycerate-and formate-dehydrogenase [Neofusicoccum parvum]
MPSIIQPNTRPKVLVLGSPKYAGDDFLAEFQKSHDVTTINPPTRAALLATLPATTATHGPFAAVIARVDPAPYDPFDAALLAPLLPHLRLLASAQAGHDAFDLPLLTRRRVWFCNSRDAVADATADVALLLLLAVVRDAVGAAGALRGGRWRGGVAPTADVADVVVGVVGMGAVGRAFARRVVRGLGGRVVYWTRAGRVAGEVERAVVGEEGEGMLRCCGSLGELLAVADVVSLHVPLSEGTKGLVGREELAMMKRGSYLLNTARGGVVDEEALIEALESGHVRRAGLDVFEGEEDGGKGIREYWLKSDKVVVLPHMGGLTERALGKAQRECFENVRRFFETGRPVAPVNEVDELSEKGK